MKAELVPHFLRRRYRAVHEPDEQLQERRVEQTLRPRTGVVTSSTKSAPEASGARARQPKAR